MPLVVELDRLECTLDGDIFQTRFSFWFDEILINPTVTISVIDIVNNVVVSTKSVNISNIAYSGDWLPVPVGFNTSSGALLANCQFQASITGAGANGERFVSQTFSCAVEEQEE